jgi:2-methylcitrate dehydratase PrpD
VAARARHLAQRALHLALDAVGCALAARREDFALKLSTAIAALDPASPGRRGVAGFSRRLPLRDAVWLQGVLMHGLDYDDTHMAGVVHLTVGVLPAVLALGAERDASGVQVATAYIAGLEAGARIASVVKGGLHAQGFHPTGVIGCFAAALACGKLLQLSPGAAAGRARHGAVDGQRQPAVPGRRRLDQAPAPRLGRTGRPAGRDAGGARHSRAGRTL